MVVVFMIVGKNDKPLFELELGDKVLLDLQLSLLLTKKKGEGITGAMAQFILHSSLDVVEEVMWTKQDL